ncbi:alpha/beta fold hydrolase [Streptomyces sp. WMMC500]|uniref:alpha/beta fold hydrolase n=1 Tax=Streptomyces sp. WMMC500 TaxID=3015154 RepID=UPI00248A9013|nr:alpha/beta fold hydrolase [Streptomyces sp. WMMC500]WBB63061.1 alpha/beta fold hydrolase [Streptomyces sp. WMMC500]
MREIEVESAGGRRLHVYDTGAGRGGGSAGGDDSRLAVFWHHGTPNVGAPPGPLLPVAERLGLRWVSYDRPGYGGSAPWPGRDMASAAALAVRVADELGIERFAAVGHSSGGPHALACGALAPERVAAVVSIAGPAPYGAAGLDWFTGMTASVAGSLRAAVAGRAAKEKHEAEAAYDPEMFTPADHAALAGPWSWFDDVVGPAVAGGPGGLIDDDLANVGPWGFDPAAVAVPTLLLHGGRDRIIPYAHAEWLARRCPAAELWAQPDDGHISVLESAAVAALEWLSAHRQG